MTTNNAFDRDKLILNNPQDPNNPGIEYFSFPKYPFHFPDAESYGTFTNDTGGGSPMTTTTVSSYPYAMGSQSPTIMVLGTCPVCKVCLSLSIIRMMVICYLDWNIGN
jgi:hypothetical protein